MAGSIKGITISFRGDTTQLSKAINQMRGEAKGLDKELGYIKTALKFDPKNVDLLKQKSTLWAALWQTPQTAGSFWALP